MKKILSIILLGIIYVCFVVFVVLDNSAFTVLKVISPSEIVVDFNKNSIQDNNEIVAVSNIITFSSLFDDNDDGKEMLKLSDNDAIGLGYLSLDFAKNTLEGRKVKVKNGEVYLDGINFRDLILTKGFALDVNGNQNEAFKKNLQNAKKLNLVILNLKNYKYHTLDCPYGRMAQNYIIVPKSQLIKTAEPCKVCHVDKRSKKDNVPAVKSNFAVLSANVPDIKMFVTDFTVHLKPNSNCTDLICKTLVREINSAKESIDFAIYGYTKVPKVEEALKRALQRGVKIRFVFDTNNNKTYYSDSFYLANIIKLNNRDVSRAIMHNKFFIFDNKKVYTGSANLSNNDMSGFNSNAVIVINSNDIASAYTKEFEQMYNGKFHEQKSKVNKLNNSKVKVYFSPADDIIYTQVIPLINQAKKYVYVPAFVLTHDKMSESLIAAKNRGVDVKVIVDATNTKSPSKAGMLRAANIPVKTENYAGKLHSKSVIIDDKYLVVGSMNFSKSGALYNDENVLIIQDETLAKFYKNFFVYLWNKIPNKFLHYNPKAESKDSIGSCSDGIDNDYDGDIDMDDDGC